MHRRSLGVSQPCCASCRTEVGDRGSGKRQRHDDPGSGRPRDRGGDLERQAAHGTEGGARGWGHHRARYRPRHRPARAHRRATRPDADGRRGRRAGPGHARRVPASGTGSSHAARRAHPGGNRRGQGSPGARDPRALASAKGDLHRYQLRRAQRFATGERAVRSREGRVHRRRAGTGRSVRGGCRRHRISR